MNGFSWWPRRSLRSTSRADTLVVILALLCSAGVAAAADKGPVQVLERLSRTLRSQTAWHGTYEQEYVPAGMTLGDTAEGEVWVAWPDRARFTTGRPPVREMALEGRSVRLVDLELGTCDEHMVSDDEWARIPLAAVLDPQGAIDRFTLVEVEGGVVLVPRTPGGVAKVELVLGTDGMPSQVVVTDVQGAVNRLTFREWRPSEGLPGGRWLPDPPAGVSCSSDDPGEIR
jgi:outer membrane lipoprotein-sorting protein